MTYSYDQANRLINYNSGAGTYSYDGGTSKSAGATSNSFVYDIAEGLAMMLSDNVNNYIYGPNGLPIEQVNGSTVTYLQQDQLGSTRVLIDSESPRVSWRLNLLRGLSYEQEEEVFA